VQRCERWRRRSGSADGRPCGPGLPLHGKELRPGVTVQVLARAGSRLWAAAAQYGAATLVSLAAVHADVAAVTPTAPVQVTLWLTPSVVLEGEGAPIGVVRVGSLGPGVAFMWSAWGERR